VEASKLSSYEQIVVMLQLLIASAISFWCYLCLLRFSHSLFVNDNRIGTPNATLK